MGKTLLMMGCLITCIFCSCVVNGQILSPVAHLEGTIDTDTMAFFVGNTRISGEFSGYRIDDLLDSPVLEELDAIPLFGSSSLNNVDSVTIIDIDTIGGDLIDNIFNFTDKDIIRFRNVNIFTQQGPFVLGFNDSKLVTDSNLDFAISSIVNIQLDQQNNLPFLALISTSNIDMNFQGDAAFLAQPYEEGNITIEDRNGNLLWNENSSNKIFYINDERFSIHQGSPLHLIPMVVTGEDIELSVAPANLNLADIDLLIDEVTNVSQEFGEISGISDTISKFDEIIPVISSIVNGGIILVEIDEVFTIDDSPQKFSNFGFARGEQFEVTISPESQTALINGDYKLIFLGDHFYTTQAKDSAKGIAIPVIIIIFWVIAIVLFFLFKYYIKTEKIKKIELNKNQKRIFLTVHIIILVVVFILMDLEISYQFGTSALSLLSGQGFSLITGIFILVQLIMWVLGYVLLAIPIYFITMYGLKMIGISKEGKHLGKAIAAFSIWFFCAIYVKLIVNIVFLVLNPGNLFQMG